MSARLTVARWVAAIARQENRKLHEEIDLAFSKLEMPNLDTGLESEVCFINPTTFFDLVPEV